MLFFIKIAIILIFAYNLMTTVSDPTAQGWIAMITFALVALGLFFYKGKQLIIKLLMIVAVIAIILYIVSQLGIL